MHGTTKKKGAQDAPFFLNKKVKPFQVSPFSQTIA
jgi:hypothetical protein